MKEYLHNIVEAVVTIAKGMRITIQTFFNRTETVQYPEIDVMNPAMPGYKGHLGPVQERFRGILTVELGSCIGDHLCERTCPIDCIQIEDLKGPKTTAKNLAGGKDMPKTRYPSKFDIHTARCMYCGLCVDACPTGAIHFTREFEASTGNYPELIRRFVSKEEANRIGKMAEEEAARKKIEDAKKAEEAAKKAAEGGAEAKPAKSEESKGGDS